MSIKRVILLSILLTNAVITCGIISSPFVSADDTDVIDEIGIEIPISCTMSGTGTNTHYASIPNGIYSGSYTDSTTGTSYANGIGTTTIKAFCNDNQGFSIYAIGYTDNIEGKNVLTNSTLGSTYDIITGTATGPVGGNDLSNWSMKLSTITSPTPTYPIAIQNSFDSYHEVPDDYTLVAKRESATDVGQNAVGSTLTTTYAAYISKTQPTGLYEGQVKYTMVHPYDAVQPEIPLGLCTSSLTCMQQQTPTSLAQKLKKTGDTITLYDARDNQAYTVAKLADGRYWMTENLNISGGTALSSEDTDFDSGYILPTTDGWTVNDDKLILPVSAIKNDYNDDFTDSAQFSTDNYAYVYNSGQENCSDEQNAPCASYYSWDAATLGSGRTISTENTDAPYSICPKNWRLPIMGTDWDNGWKRGDIYRIASAYGVNLENDYYDSSATFYNNAGLNTGPNFTLSGYGYNGSFYNGGSSGHYWSSTSNASTSGAQRMEFSKNHIDSTFYRDRRSGFSVRCVMDPTPNSLEHAFEASGKTKYNAHYKIQDMDSSICASASEGQTIDLIDERDDEVYKVAKLRDGNCWMLENLRLDPLDSDTAENMNGTNTNATQEAINNLLNGGSTNTGWSNTAVINTDNFSSQGQTQPFIKNEYKNNLVAGYGLGSPNNEAKVGVYYSYCAASASTYCYNTNVDKPNTLIDAEQDLCPAHWRMPTGGSTGDYKALSQKYGSDATSNNSLQYNLSLAKSGYNGYSSSTYSFWWSSTYAYGSGMYLLQMSNNDAVVEADYRGYNNYYGFPMRCVAK